MRAVILVAAAAEPFSVAPGAFLLVAALLVGSAFFAGSETAVVSASRARLERRAEEGRRDARTALALLRDTPRTIAATLVGNNLCNIGAASLATAIAVALSPEHGPTIATLVLTPVVLFTAEILPKALFRARPTRALSASASALQVCTVLFRPIMALTTWATRVMLFVLRVPETERRAAFRREDLENLFLYGAPVEEGLRRKSSAATLRMAGRVLALVKRSVAEAMVPLAEGQSLPCEGTVGDALRLFRRARTGILAALDTDGRVAGFIAAKELLGEPADRSLAAYLRPAYVLLPTDSLDHAITGLRRNRHSIGLVRDLDGSTLGILTPEDVLEEVLGELHTGEETGGPGGPESAI